MDSLFLKLIEGAVERIGERLVDEGILPPTPPKVDRSYVVLCVELGHQRCKLALVEVGVENRTVTISIPKKLEIVTSNSFLNEEGFEAFIGLLIKTQNASTTKIDGLALSLSCPTSSEKGIIDTTYSLVGWSRNIQQILHQKVGYDCILVVNDAVAFALDCRNNDQIINDLQLPVLAITLGGGIGGSLIQQKKPFVTPYEMGDIWKVWENGFEGNPHTLAGQSFFDWVSRETNWETEEIRLNFSQHLAWIINAVREQKIRFNSVIVGGGNAAHIDQLEVSRNLQKPCKLCVSRLPEVSLYGAAKLWVDHFHYGQSLSELVDSNI